MKVRSLRGARGEARLRLGGSGLSSLEAALCTIWQEVLADGRPVGRDDDFLSLGGDSLQTAQVLARVEALFGFRPALAEFFDAATPARLAAVIATARRGCPCA